MSKKRITTSASFVITIAVFILTFFIYFRETHKFFSSLTASSLSSVLVFVVIVVVGWFVRAFMKT